MWETSVLCLERNKIYSFLYWLGERVGASNATRPVLGVAYITPDRGDVATRGGQDALGHRPQGVPEPVGGGVRTRRRQPSEMKKIGKHNPFFWLAVPSRRIHLCTYPRARLGCTLTNPAFELREPGSPPLFLGWRGRSDYRPTRKYVLLQRADDVKVAAGGSGGRPSGAVCVTRAAYVLESEPAGVFVPLIPRVAFYPTGYCLSRSGISSSRTQVSMQAFLAPSSHRCYIS